MTKEMCEDAKREKDTATPSNCFELVDFAVHPGLVSCCGCTYLACSDCALLCAGFV